MVCSPSPVTWPRRAGSITECLGTFKLRLGSYSHEAKVPFIRAIRTSVRFVLKRRVELLIHFNRRTVRLFCAGRMNRTLIFWLEVRSNNHYTIPAVVTTFGVGVTFYVNGEANLTNITSVSFNDKPSLQNVSFYRPKLNKRLNVL